MNIYILCAYEKVVDANSEALMLNAADTTCNAVINTSFILFFLKQLSIF